MKRWLKNTIWICSIIAVAIGMSFVNSAQKQVVMGLPIVKIDLYEDMLFLTTDDILNRLIDQDLIGINKKYTEMDLNEIEQFLSQLPEVKTVDVYTHLGGAWNIDISLRRPIARIFNLDGSSCYLDSDGTLNAALSKIHRAHFGHHRICQ
jgi:cell division protein FtsQ